MNTSNMDINRSFDIYGYSLSNILMCGLISSSLIP